MELNPSPLPSEENFSQTKALVGVIWGVSLFVVFFMGFYFGQGKNPTNTTSEKNVLAMQENPPTVTPTILPSPQITPEILNNNVCKTSGFAQKWEFLTSYTIKENDSLQSIATEELKDSSRMNEIMQINGVGPLVVGSILYLPPKIVTKSSGNLKQVAGRLVEKNTVNWQVSFNGDKSGQGLLIPSFWFGEIQDKDTYVLGDCLNILFDDGYKVFSVNKQK